MASSKRQTLYLTIIFLTILDICLLTYVFFYPVQDSLKQGVFAFDFIICIILWVEFIYSYLHSENKKQYLRDNALSILGLFPLNFCFLRALRLIRLIQLIKLFVLARDSERAYAKFLRRTYLDKIILVAIVFIFLETILIRIIDPNINDLPTALWYIVVSLTSTGYGDIVPANFSGKIIGMITMIGGILIFSALTAVISSIYVSKISEDSHDDLKSKIDDLTLEIKNLNEKIDELENKKD